MFRHEDAPFCGCGPEGCIDTTRTVSCHDCGTEYHPDAETETLCWRCIAIREIEEEERREWEAENYGEEDEEGDREAREWDELQAREWEASQNERRYQ